MMLSAHVPELQHVRLPFTALLEFKLVRTSMQPPTLVALSCMCWNDVCVK